MHIDNPIFLLLLAIAGLFRWLASRRDAEKANDARQPAAPPPAPRRAIPRADEQTDEERVRRFLEALGQPASSTPPPKIQPRTAKPKRAALPPLTTTPPPLPQPTTLEVLPTQSPADVPRQPATISPRVYRPREPQSPTVAAKLPTTIGPRNDLGARLTSGENLRDIVLLREIFGPPRALQTSELLGG